MSRDLAAAGDQEALPSPQERTWGMLCHLSALVALIGFPFGSILGPLIWWLIKKNESSFVDAQGREALNFGLSTLIYALVCLPLCLILIGIPMLLALGVFWVIMVVMSSIRANEGRAVRYPLTIRFL
jgi:uncharacterized Tic20 family protein